MSDAKKMSIVATETAAFEDESTISPAVSPAVDAALSTRVSPLSQLPPIVAGSVRPHSIPYVAEQNATEQNQSAQNVPSENLDVRGSGILNLQVWFEGSPFRSSAAWTVVAGVLALGYPSTATNLDIKTIALLILLADPLWGSIWRLGFGRQAILALHSTPRERSFWLPYLRSNSPASQLMANGGVSANNTLPLLMRVALPSVAIATAVALVLGLPAVWMTMAVVICSLLAWLVRHNGQNQPYLLYAIVVVALPWGITLSLLSTSSTAWAADGLYWAYQIALLLLWTLHVWGEGELTRNVRSTLGLTLLFVADIGIGTLLIVAKVPLWLLFISILWLPTWLSIYQRNPMERIRIWWLLAMLMSAIALGQGFI